MDLPENVVTLADGDRKITLVGTAHVSQESVNEVCSVIETVRPDTVCIELCPTRYEALTKSKVWQDLDIFKVIREGKTLMLLASLALSAHQRRIGKALGVKPGAEMLAAAEKAQEIGADVVLIDRNVQITLKRTWRNITFWNKLSLLGGALASVFEKQEVDADQVEKLKQSAHLSELMREFAEAFPDVKEPLIDERDRYMMEKIKQCSGKNIVAVVGAGHVPGMTGQLGKTEDCAQLETVPPASRWVASLKWIIPAVIVCAFIVGYFKNRGQTLKQMLFAWILPNSVAAAVCTAMVGAKLLSVVVALFASPVTSLNPLLGAGMVVGLVEAWLRKPTVADAERINEDVETLRGVFRNPFTRVLLVVAFSTLGSAMGAWIGATWVITLLAD